MKSIDEILKLTRRNAIDGEGGLNAIEAKTELEKMMATERLEAKLKQAEELEIIFEDRNNALAKRFCHFLAIGIKDKLEQLIAVGKEEG